MNKSDRQKLISEIIENYEIDTQEELASLLNLRGAKVTQVTVSRDIKELNLIKTAGKIKKYKYSRVIVEDPVVTGRNLNFFRETVTSIEEACNLLVVKTLSGNAQAVAAIMDRLSLGNIIIGTVAGDDTVLIVTKSNKDAFSLSKKLKEFINKDA